MAYQFADVVVDAGRRTIVVRGQGAPVGARAFDLLVALIDRRDRVVPKDELIDIVWPRSVVEENNLQVHISALRKVLGAQAIATVAGRGYRFTLPLAGESPRFAAAEAPAPPTNLPASEPELLGRDADLQSLVALVRAHRLVTTSGAGGMGKTTLAQATGYRLRDAFADGAWMVRLAPVTQPQLLPGAVARALHLTLDVEGNPEALAAAIGSRRLLVILDNCEHLLSAAAELAASVLRSAPGAHLLVTSQEPLKIQGEHVFRLPPMAVPDEATIDLARPSGAVMLFAARAAEADPGFQLTAGNIAAVIDICRRLDGIALAIELAAARVPLLGIAGLRARLDERFRVLTTGGRLALPRHQTLRAAMDWSHGLLTEAEQRAFRRLGVLVGSFSLDAAEQVVAGAPPGERWQVLDLLGSLVDKSLVVALPGETPRYRLLETSRAYALERLVETAELQATCALHAQAMADLFERSRAEEFTSTLSALLAKYLPDLDNARAALEWLASRPADAALHVALAGGMGWLWQDAALRPEGIRRTREAVALIPGRMPALPEARLLLTMARISFPLAGAELLAGIDRAVEILRDGGPPQARYTAFLQAAITLARASRLHEAEAMLAQAKALLDPAWPPALRAEYFNAVTLFLGDARRTGEARPALDEALALTRRCGDVRRALRPMINAEQASAFLGDYERAVELGREMLLLLQSDPSLRGGMVNIVLGNLAMALVMAGEVQEALDVARQAYAPVQREGRALEMLDPFAMLALKRGRADDASRIIGRSMAHFSQPGVTRMFVEQKVHDQVLAQLRDRMAPAALDVLVAEGGALDGDAALQLALRD